MSKPLPTIADLARATGLAPSTVSLALRGGHGKVRPATIERVRATATEMGYQPNGPGALLARQRFHGRASASRVPIAVPTTNNNLSGLLARGFQRKAEALGLEMRMPKVDHSNPESFLRQMWATGVNGLCLLPGLLPWDVELIRAADWSRFSVIQLSRDDRLGGFHLVRLSAFDFMWETIDRVFAAGYRRVGVVVNHSPAARDNHARMGAVLAYRTYNLPPNGQIQIHLSPSPTPNDADRNKLKTWLNRHRFQALVVFPFSWFYLLRELGYQIPEDFGLAAVMRYEKLRDTPELSGCDADDETLGARCAERLGQLLAHGERGRPVHPLEDVIEPRWVEGVTLPTIN